MDYYKNPGQLTGTGKVSRYGQKQNFFSSYIVKNQVHYTSNQRYDIEITVEIVDL
jgi:hypothetical protein